MQEAPGGWEWPMVQLLPHYLGGNLATRKFHCFSLVPPNSREVKCVAKYAGGEIITFYSWQLKVVKTFNTWLILEPLETEIPAEIKV